MRHLRLLVLATVAVVLCAPPAARAYDPHKHRSGAVITPSKGRYLGETWAQLFSLPLSVNPEVGKGNPCLRVGPKVVGRSDPRRPVHHPAGHGADDRPRQRVQQRRVPVSGH